MSPATDEPLTPEEFSEKLEVAAKRLGTPLSPAATANLSTYLAEIDRWRRRINLTGQLSATELVEHVLEALAGSSLIPHGARVIDIGSGAGLPGLPLAITRDDIRMTLLEPKGKKAAFLRHASRLLAADRIEVIESSIEELRVPLWTVATTRALGDLGRLIGDAPQLETAGLILCWTTEPESIATALKEHFARAGVTAVPGSRKRVILALRKR